jgi:hypothetical protein
MDCIISPITIDLGGKKTGLFLTQYTAGEAPDLTNSIATTLVMPEEGSGATWSQQQRTATRHRLRSCKRRKLAKRLVNSVFFDGLKRPLSSKEQQAIQGLLNRRGYNRLEADADDNQLNSADTDWFAKVFPNHFNNTAELAEQVHALCQSPDKIRQFQHHELLTKSKTEIRKFLGKEYSTEEKKSLIDAFTALKTTISNALSQLDYGHQHRRDYIKAIAKEIHRDSRLKKLRDETGEKKLLNLIGNISNFQLRTLRWYFNNQKSNTFDGRKLHQTVYRWIYNFHPKHNEERKQRQEVLHALKQEPDILKALMSISAAQTIPPYEDQNNRRPPKDRTLWLSPEQLERYYPGKWRIWAKNLASANPEYTGEINNIINLIDRNSRRKQTIEKDKLMTAIFCNAFSNATNNWMTMRYAQSVPERPATGCKAHYKN